MNDNLYSTVPQNNFRILKARQCKNEALIAQFSKILPITEKLLSKKTNEVREYIQKIDINKKINPDIYATFNELCIGLKNQSLHHVSITLDSISKLTPYNDVINLSLPDSSFSWKYATNNFNTNPMVDVFGRGIKTYPKKIINIEKYKNSFFDVLEKINIVDPLLANEVVNSIASCYVFKGICIMGASFENVYGAIFISIPEDDKTDLFTYLVEHIVHESSHNLLYSLMSMDKLITNSANDTYEAPLRPDKRPMYGIFHATFVVARMMRTFRKLAQHGHVNSEIQFKKLIPRLDVGIKAINEHGILTSNGKALASTLRECAYE